MEKIIEQLKKALDSILGIATSLKAERDKVAETSTKQDKAAQALGQKEAELEKRETAVKPIEDVVAYKVAAEKIAEESDKGRIILENAKNAFEAYKTDETAKIAAQRQEVEKDAAMYKRELAALAKAKEDVEAERAKVKGKVLGELAKNV